MAALTGLHNSSERGKDLFAQGRGKSSLGRGRMRFWGRIVDGYTGGEEE